MLLSEDGDDLSCASLQGAADMGGGGAQRVHAGKRKPREEEGVESGNSGEEGEEGDGGAGEPTRMATNRKGELEMQAFEVRGALRCMCVGSRPQAPCHLMLV